MYYLGIDISKKSFTVSVLDEEGEAITKVITFRRIRKTISERPTLFSI